MPYFFQLPRDVDLTVGQRPAINNPTPISVSGGPGTGKTIVSLWRHIRNHENNKQSLLITYTKTLEYYLSECAGGENKNAQKNISRTYYWLTHLKNQYNDEIIVDEAQDVELSYFKELRTCTNSLSYGIDPYQSIYLSEEELQELKNGLPSLFQNTEFILDENFRNTYEITQFIRSLFPHILIPDGREHGPKPTIIVTGDNREKKKTAIINIIQEFQSDTHNIAILLPQGKDYVNSYYNFIKNAGINASKYYHKIEFMPIENVHITTFKSSKGIEFDTVIIPGFDKMQSFIKDNSRKYEHIKENDYYVALSRTRTNLYLIVESIPSFLSKQTKDLCEIFEL